MSESILPVKPRIQLLVYFWRGATWPPGRSESSSGCQKSTAAK